MSKVWIVKQGIHYEGSHVIAVCETRDKALLKIEQRKREEVYPDAKWEDRSYGDIILWDDGVLYITAAQWDVE